MNGQELQATAADESTSDVAREMPDAASVAEPAPGPPQPATLGPAGKSGGQPGNANAMKSGARSARPEAVAALNARVDEILNDLGGPDALSALARGQAERHARLEMVDEYLWSNLQQHGPLTGKGRTRAALTAWLAVVDRLQKSATALGLERRTKPINPIDAIRAAVVEANK